MVFPSDELFYYFLLLKVHSEISIYNQSFLEPPFTAYPANERKIFISAASIGFLFLMSTIDSLLYSRVVTVITQENSNKLFFRTFLIL